MASFFTELKRRNVYRAAAFYAAASWLLVQIATQVFPFFDIPNWSVRLVVIVVAAGFPFALLFSWFYELTPQGIKRESEVDRGESIVHVTGKKLDRWIIATLGLAVVLLLADKFVLRKPISEVAIVPGKSIAVLPFANTSGDTANEYFSDGLSEELISSLSRLSDLKVIGRTSSFQFKGKTDDSIAIGQKLGVVYLLEGSVRKSSERVRIAVELVKSADGANVWSESYDRELKDIFAVQSEIAGTVASQLKVALLGKNAQAVQAPSPATPSNQNVDAYTAWLQGNFHFLRHTADDVRTAITYFEEAIRLDPKYAQAYASLASAETQIIGIFSVNDRKEWQELAAKARKHAETALVLDPGLGSAHFAHAFILQVIDLDISAAAAEYQRAAELAPQFSPTFLSLGVVSASFGRIEEATVYGRRAIALDPLNATNHIYLARFLDALGRYDEAESATRKAIELQPQGAQSHTELATLAIQRGDPSAAVNFAKQETDPFWRTYALALAHFANGDRTEADVALKQMIDRYADSGAYQIAIVYALRKDADKVFEWLDRGLATRDPGVVTLRYGPFLGAYGADPRFAAFCRKVGVPPSGESVPAKSVGAPPAATAP